MKRVNIEKAFQLWQERKLLDTRTVDQLRAALEEHDAGFSERRGIVLFSMLGAVLVGLGIILFVASHWTDMSPVLRATTLVLTYGLACGCAYVTQTKGMPRVSESLWFLATVVLGADIFLIGQIFNYTLTFWQGPFLWLIGTLVMGHARKKSIYGWMAVPLALLTLGWLGGGSGWFFDDQTEFLFGERGLLPLFPLLGLTLISGAGLLRHFKIWPHARSSWTMWGIFLTAASLVATTVDDDVAGALFQMSYTSKQVAIVIGSLATIAGFVLLDRTSHEKTRSTIAIGSVILVLFLIQAGDDPVIGILVEQSILSFGLYVALIFVATLLCVWAGLLERSHALVNTGLASAALIIVMQYFSWSTELLDRSIAFILGGIVLIGLSIAMERARSHLLKRMETP